MGFFKHVFFSICAISLANPVGAERIIRVEPGLWEYSYDMEIPGVPIPSGSARKECISAEDAQQELSNLLSQLATSDAKCTVTDMKDTLNTLKFDVACRPKISGINFTSSGKAVFKYGRTKVTGNVSGMVTINQGEPVFVLGKGHAHRVGRCPK